ncbi:autotransporter outer membrane beta-barrel domain-containing protein [Bordetella sp. LUAb4]|uniref:autotransporter outer membrane beta-barrel domain-containing protein n=1 Tax=Bordetella sp. LUAb4 TaxID=2843195 RepID=UPI001E65C227|nr:autotransporter outer membrane beta-barrel domain-containing protein [Bordetella sp. LUAb4]
MLALTPLLSALMLAGLMTPRAEAALSCPSASSSTSSTITCTIDASQGGSGAQISIDYTAAAGTGTNIGSYGGNYIVNNAANLSPSSPQGGLFIRLKGGAGSSDTSNNGTNGGNGGTITITNSGTINVNNSPTSSNQSSAPGIWDDTGAQFGIYAASVGGRGADAGDTVIGGGNGGAGGQASAITITNTGAITLNQLPYGGVGIYAAGIGGGGGNQDNAATGDQVGGNGGDTNIININNSASININSGSAGRYAWGIGVESIGGNGGNYNGNGGEPGEANTSTASSITNSGAVTVSVNGSGMSNGVRGLYILNQGGNGQTSEDGSDNGGAGANVTGLTVTNAGAINVTTTNALGKPASLAALSGGIVMIGQGGNGGMGPQTVTNTSGELGGKGGDNPYTFTATMNSGSVISTAGDYLPGVAVISLGGNGGAGREDSDGANGGYGGTIKVAMTGNASITTSGTESIGIIARSAGGAGGGVETSSGIIDFTPENAGTGGNGGQVSISTSGGTITTYGTNSIGMLAQSMGGFGGGTTSNFELFGDAGANAGNGGTPSTVTISSATTIATSGDNSHGIVAQSIGGGGGVAGVSSGIVALGGSGGNAIGGGTVNVTQSAGLTTTGTSAIGILAQSVGGGGGDGGGSTGMITIGGQAGSGGGSGGATTATLSGGSIHTSGDTSYGMVAQSIGGGGGTGGAASSLSVSALFSMSVAVGGSGGGGGAGSTANAVLSNSSITTGSSGTTTTDAHGLVVQSIGGGGGAGGASVARAYAIAVPDDSVSVGAAVSFAVGGSGGNGGAGARAEADLSGSSITTYGAGSFGMLVQSIGGGGGVGGNATATSTVIGTDSSVGATVSAAFGGNGGSAACGSTSTSTCASTTTVNLNGGNRIQTWGDSANGIVAQSIGGGGGAGGIGSASGSNRNTDASVSATLSLGGTGSGGGTAGSVVFNSTYTDSVITAGDGARGVLLQSIGGGGGASQGGQIGLSLSSESEDGSTDVSGTVNVGRGGTSGGAGSNITLVSNGQITTYGADADGLLVQTIGGSGGLGGVAGGNSADPSTGVLRKAIGTLQDDSTSYELNVGVGGTGGGGGNGGAIGSTSAAASIGSRINTYGDHAEAVVLQSIGGGGGQGGASTTSSSSNSSHLTMSVGGKGGTGGSGGDIIVYFNDAFENGLSGNLFNTNGFGSHGVVLQSIGGGGGIGASGSPMANGTITVGRDGGGAGNGGNITVNQASWANISTHGDSAYGLVLQSIGGGGGIGIAGDSDSAASPGKQQLSLTLGGRNGASGSGGNINVSTGLGMNTYGDRAIGVLAQSIGGGGGVVTTGSASGLGALSLGGTNGSGGTVNVDITGGSITTRGNGAHAIIAQSIGGGGGIIGDTGSGIQLNPANGGLPSGTGGNGNGSAVTVTTNATLATSGRNAFGIIAQSLGGGGGIAGSASNGFAGNLFNSSSGGVASAVTVNQSGSISVTGAGSTGIFAQSEAPYNNGVVTVNVNGSVAGGSSANGFGYGVWIAQGINNVLNVASSGSISAASGVAVHYDGDTDQGSGNKLTITNNGVINGSVQCTDADTGANCGYSAPGPAAMSFVAIPASAVLGDAAAIQLHNAQGGTLAGASLYQADVTNEGQLIIGNPGPFNELRISNSFVQSSTGVIRADADFDKLNTDHLTVAGNATLAGGVNIVPTALLPNREVTVMTVQGQSQGALEAQDSPVIDYGLRQDGQDFKVRAVSANFNAPGLGLKSNQGKVADFLQRVWDGGGNSALAPLFAQLDLSSRASGGAYRANLDSLSPGAIAAPAAQSMAALGQFTGNMMSCPAFTDTKGNGAMTREQNCFWGLVSGRRSSQDGERGSSDFDFDSVTYQFGGQRQVSPGWFLGASMAYQNNDVKGDNGRLKGNGDSGYAGLVLKRESGPWVFSGALGGGYGSYRMNRDVIVPGYQDTLKSKPDMYNFGLRLRAARTFDFDNMYVKPYMDFDATYTRMSSYKENGNNALGLSVDSSHQYVLGVSPMIEVGGRKDLPNGAFLRPFAYVGVAFLNKDSWNSNARLQGAPADAGSFSSSTPMDDVIGRIGAGFQVSTAKGVDFRLQYDGELAKHAKSHSGSLKVMVPF